MITDGMAERAAGQRGSKLRNRLARASCAVRPRVHHKRGDTLTRSAVARRCHGVLNQFDDRLAGGRACDAKVRAPYSRKREGIGAGSKRPLKLRPMVAQAAQARDTLNAERGRVPRSVRIDPSGKGRGSSWRLRTIHILP